MRLSLKEEPISRQTACAGRVRGSQCRRVCGSSAIPCPWWWADSYRWWCATDIATPLSLANGEWPYDDLEIDVWDDEAGFRGVVDEDEFEQARLSVPFPASTTKSALASRDEVIPFMTAGTEPFGSVGWEQLRSAPQEFDGTMA
jgi:hypothetical protein